MRAAPPNASRPALCDILDCSPNDLFEPYVELRAAATANAPTHPQDIGVTPGQLIARRIHLVPEENDESS